MFLPNTLRMVYTYIDPKSTTPMYVTMPVPWSICFSMFFCMSKDATRGSWHRRAQRLRGSARPRWMRIDRIKGSLGGSGRRASVAVGGWRSKQVDFSYVQLRPRLGHQESQRS